MSNKTHEGFCLINELFEAKNPEIISQRKGTVVIEAELQQAGTLNRNRRYYDKNDLLTQIQSPRTQELLKTRNLFGEAGHPITKDLTRQGSIDPKLVSHLIEDIWMEGDIVKGRISSVDNEYGRFFASCIRSGTKVAFSLRAVGRVVTTSKGTKVESPKMITYDWVIFPSYPTAYQSKVVSESSSIEMLSESGLVIPETPNKLIIENADYDGCNSYFVSNEEIENCINSESTLISDLLQDFTIDESTVQLIGDGSHIQFKDSLTNNTYKMNKKTKIANDILDYYGNL